MEVKFIEDSKSSPNIVIVTDSKLELPSSIKEIETIANISIAQTIECQGYKAKHGEVLVIPTANEKIHRIIVVSVGELDKLDIPSALKVGGKIYSSLQASKGTVAKLYFSVESAEEKKEALFNIMLGALIKSYKFDKYFTKKKKDGEEKVETIEVVYGKPNQTNVEFEKVQAIYQGGVLTKKLVSEPANVLNPETFADTCLDLIKFGLEIEILEEEDMAKLNMNALLGVARGSRNSPKLVCMHWKGGDWAEEPIAFVGKGVTFDTGGLSLKPSGAMSGMKYDMAGAGVVTGLMKTLALRKAKVNVVGVIGLVENMPDGNAQRPEDIVKSMSGQTIEVLNTDAEGRLVLADALWYTQDKYKPKFIVDIATLTGAIVVTFANQHAGLFSNDDSIAEQLFAAGEKTGEQLWRLPLSKEYDKMVDSKMADMQNIGSGRGAGSITAAQFLQRFVNDVPWAHIDIAGVTDSKKSSDINQLGATAFGLRVLNQFVADYYEKQ
jgi:leucyl aminopeptidase